MSIVLAVVFWLVVLWVAVALGDLWEGNKPSGQSGRARWRFRVPAQVIIAPTAIVCATVVWPSDLSWGLLVLAALTVLTLWSFSVGFDD